MLLGLSLVLQPIMKGLLGKSSNSEINKYKDTQAYARVVDVRNKNVICMLSFLITYLMSAFHMMDWNLLVSHFILICLEYLDFY